MPKYIVDGSDLTSVANAIRTAGETSESLTFPSGFVSAIGNLVGSSDFSTATITIVDPDELMESFYCPVIVDGRADYQFQDDPSEGITVILYNGEAVVDIAAAEGTIITESGNVTVENHKYIVTGDATFTFSAP